MTLTGLSNQTRKEDENHMDTKIEKAIAKLAERMQPGGMTPEEQEAYAQFLEIASKMPAEALRDLTRRMEFAVSVMEIQKAG